MRTRQNHTLPCYFCTAETPTATDVLQLVCGDCTAAGHFITRERSTPPAERPASLGLFPELGLLPEPPIAHPVAA